MAVRKAVILVDKWVGAMVAWSVGQWAAGWADVTVASSVASSVASLVAQLVEDSSVKYLAER